jgi:hypothetical protein
MGGSPVSKQIQNSNVSMFKTELTRVYSFGHLDFENSKIVSDFDIRYSIFVFEPPETSLNFHQINCKKETQG